MIILQSSFLMVVKSPNSFTTNLDRNYLGEKLYFIKKGGRSIDDLAISLSNASKMDITDFDIVEFIRDYNSSNDYWNQIQERIKNDLLSYWNQDQSMKTYEGKITSLKSNQVFVFGSNPLGVNGNPSKGTGGAALVAHNIAGVKQGEKMDNKLSDSGKAWGITTVSAPGQKRSKSPEEIKEGIRKLYNHAEQNPDKNS